MSLDELTTHVSEPAAPTIGEGNTASETEVLDESTYSEDVEVEASGENEGATEDQGDDDPLKGYTEVEVNGKRFKVPEELKDGYLRQDDYTRKRQADAEFKRQLEAKAAEVARMEHVSTEELNMRSALMGVDAQLKQYEGVDFLALQREDPLGAQEHWMRFQQLKDAKSQISGQLTETQKQRTELVERDIANRIQETAKYAYENLPGMSKELDDKITQFAINDLGYDVDTLKRAYNPQVYRTLYLAHLGKQLLDKQSAPKPATQQPNVKPTTTVANRTGTGRKTPAQMSVDEMAAYLNKRS
jgi:hypothetical protein